MVLLAQDPGGGAGGGGGLSSLLMPLLAIGFLFYFLLIRPQQREKARRDTMIAAVKKNDRVLTVGGIYGVVTNVHREANEVTVKVDEASNAKLRITLGSIAQVLGADSPDDSSGK